jgi:hypothetical protein
VPALTPGQDPANHGLAAGSVSHQPQDWLLARARLGRRLLIEAPPWVRGRFDHAWAPMMALAGQIRALPAALWDWLLLWPGGYAVVCTGESRYVPGINQVGPERLENVAFVSVEDLATENEQPCTCWVT